LAHFRGEARFRTYHAKQKDKKLTEDPLTGFEFETYLMELLKEHGFDDIRTTVGTSDQGADLIAHLNGRSIVIQAKRRRGSVGNRVVQECLSASSPTRCTQQPDDITLSFTL
jgi:HJR/Mrr/RecB family endonuclease